MASPPPTARFSGGTSVYAADGMSRGHVMVLTVNQYHARQAQEMRTSSPRMFGQSWSGSGALNAFIFFSQTGYGGEA